MIKSLWVLFLSLIGYVTDASFLNHSESEVK